MGLLDLVLPTACASCGEHGRTCCATCRVELDRPAQLAWPRPIPSGLPPPWAAAAYQGVSRDLVLAYKERGAVGLSRVLAIPLAAAVKAAAAGQTAVVLVPVPSSRRAIRERGDDVVLRLARQAAVLVRRTGCRVRVVPALRHARTVADSAGLSAHDRAKNLSGGFGVVTRQRRALAEAPVVIVDDLITTGATLVEAARVLRDAGAEVIGAATVAATQRRIAAA